MSFILASISIILISILFYCYFGKYGYWSNRGISGPRPVFPLGTVVYYVGKSMSQVDDNLAKKYGKLVGLYDAFQPVLMVADPIVIKECLISKFSSFTDVNQFVFGDLFDDFLVFKSGDDWRHMRHMINPHFSPFKIREVYDVIESCTQRLVDYIDGSISAGNIEMDAQDFCSSFTLHAIGKVAFAVDIDTYVSSKKSERSISSQQFSYHAKALFTKISMLQFLGSLLFPLWLSRWLRINPFYKPSVKFFGDLCRALAKERMSNQLKVELCGEKVKKTTSNFLEMLVESKKFSVREVEGQTFLVFVAGYETTQTLLTYCFYIFSLHPQIQERLRKNLTEITNQEELMKNDNLDAFINEVLRMYPPVVKYDRVASEDVTLTSTGTPLSLKKGTIIRVPIWHMNHNPKYFKDPEIFDPDRFTTENIDEIDMCAFTPFVIGPRTCLGKHLAIMETKCVIFHILKNFRIKKSNKSSVPMTYTPSTVLLKPTNVHVVFERLQEHNNV